MFLLLCFCVYEPARGFGRFKCLPSKVYAKGTIRKWESVTSLAATFVVAKLLIATTETSDNPNLPGTYYRALGALVPYRRYLGG